VWIDTQAASPVEHHVSHNIIYKTGAYTGIYVDSTLAKVWNNVLHEADNTEYGALSMNQASGTAYFYNNTVYDSAGDGIAQNAGTLIARNNVSMKPGSGYLDFAGTMTKATNVSSDATGNITGKTDYGNYFVDTTVGSEDLHLRNDSNSLWGSNGTDLDGDLNLPITDDIDGQGRHASAPDIGADEFSQNATPLYRSVGATITALASGAGNGLVISGSTALFDSSLPDNVGVGDAIQYDSDNNGSIDAIAFIHGGRRQRCSR